MTKKICDNTFWTDVMRAAQQICAGIHGGDCYWDLTQDKDKYWSIAYKIVKSLHGEYYVVDKPFISFKDYSAMLKGDVDERVRFLGQNKG